MKPDWKDAPEWAKFLAMDRNGEWHWYECEPNPDSYEDQWMTAERYSLASTTILAEWESTLEPRP
jgi:hypothetical protein